MSYHGKTTFELSATITGTTAGTNLTPNTSRTWTGTGIEAGGRIVFGTATSATVAITDARGVALYPSTAIVASTTIAPVPRGVKGPITVVVSAISNSAHTLSVYWTVRK